MALGISNLEEFWVSKSQRKPANRSRPGQQRPAQQRPTQGRPAASRSGSSDPAPQHTSALARKIAANSMPALIWLHTRPRWFLLVAVGLLLLLGLIIPGVVGGLLMLILAIFLAWLLLLSWPLLETGGRLSRLVLVAMVAGTALIKIFV